ncbi:MAG TPA: BNR repeat-containing protein [Pyrinomonadaceae bacterium]|nr:BNR repeat-containing protein [Pyrinomonadaceae bacterium]
MKAVRLSALFLALAVSAVASARPSARLVRVGEGWARNQVNAVIFRRNSVVSYGGTQYVAFYDAEARVVLAKRKLGTDAWELRRTQYTGDASDAHRSISIAVDGAGFLHVVWNQHDSPLQYCRSVRPGSLELTGPMPMVGEREGRVTYPEFYSLPGGRLLFLYRDGASGRGDLVLNRYESRLGRWERLQDRLIDGEGERNAYWQAAVDARGHVHLSWVWRETPDVATNHDLCYAKSEDGGRTWRKSTGEPYRLPVSAANAEYVRRIPQGSELINQTSMTADARGRPYIVTYWRPEGTRVPQYHLVYSDGRGWRTLQVTRRTTPFSLSGRGTRRIPVSRPQVVVEERRGRPRVFMIFRDEERGARVSVATCDDLPRGGCAVGDLTEEGFGMWEPTYDPQVWRTRRELHLFVQRVGQGQGETTEDIPAQPVYILEWRRP